MNKPRVNIIAAIGKNNRVLGKDGGLIWHISEDLRRFKNLTIGHPIIMGRKTYESIGRPLPGRTSIIVTRNENYEAQDCIVVDSIEKALEKSSEIEQEDIFIIGGSEIYKLGLPYTDRLYLTLIESDKTGDVYFPEYNEFTKIIEKESKSEGDLKYTYLTLEK